MREFMLGMICLQLAFVGCSVELAAGGIVTAIERCK
jgi:hypothetical protein